jgi:hypothetical protein
MVCQADGCGREIHKGVFCEWCQQVQFLAVATYDGGVPVYFTRPAQSRRPITLGGKDYAMPSSNTGQRGRQMSKRSAVKEALRKPEAARIRFVGMARVCRGKRYMRLIPASSPKTSGGGVKAASPPKRRV